MPSPFRINVTHRLLMTGLLSIGFSSYAQQAISLRRPQEINPANGPLRGEVRKLKPLVLAPNITFNFDGDGASPLPRVQAQSERYLMGDTNSPRSLLLQLRLDINPKPNTGSPETVAKRIRSVAGVGNANAGLRFSWFPEAVNSDPNDGSIGLDFRVAGQGGYQAADTVQPEQSSTQGKLEKSSFAIGTVEATLAVWLASFYLGVQYNHYWVSKGADSALHQELNKSSGLSATLTVPVRLGSQNSQPNATTPRELYFQLGATGKADLSDIVFSTSLAATFEPL